MVVTFVGFVGGWVKAALGPDTLFASAFIASAVATFFTFLPSFIFILLGGPFYRNHPWQPETYSSAYRHYRRSGGYYCQPRSVFRLSSFSGNLASTALWMYFPSYLPLSE